MKINGRKLSGPTEEVIVIPKREGDLVFRAKAILSYDDFHKLCPKPEPPAVIRPGNVRSFDVESKEYLKALDTWASLQTSWMIIQSLKATEGLEWETVDYSQPTTWGNYQKEMLDSGLSGPELNKIIECVINANGLNNKRIEEATNTFLASQAKAQST